MIHYLVWMGGAKPDNGTRIAAKSSLEARRICAAAWKKPLNEIMARKIATATQDPQP